MKTVLPILVLAIIAGFVVWFQTHNAAPASPIEVQLGQAVTNQPVDMASLDESLGSTSTSSLVTVDLSNTKLTSIPADVFTKVDTQQLNLSHNMIEGALPSAIADLTQLQILDLSNNDITDLPPQIGALSALEVLNLSNNKLTNLPSEIGNLKHLRLLDLSGNNYSEDDLANIQKNLPASTIIKVQ